VRRLLAALAAAALLSGAAGAEERAAAGPRIRVEPEGFDFGRVLQDRTLRKTFTIRNFGDADLEIEGVSSSCDCTAAQPESTVVAPGGSTTLLVRLQTRRYSGRLERRVVVRTNDAKTPLLEIAVSATVEAKPR
jgi:hypothetical protein